MSKERSKLRFYISLLLGVAVCLLLLLTDSWAKLIMRYDNLWNFLWKPLWGWLYEWLFELWRWSPTSSGVMNFLIGLLHLAIIVIVVPVSFLAVLAIVFYFYIIPYIIGWCGFALGYVIAFLIDGVNWAVSEIFSTRLYLTPRARYGDAAAVISFHAAFAFLTGVAIRYLVMPVVVPLAHKLIIKPVLLAFALVFVRGRRETGGTGMAKGKKESATPLGDPEIEIPEVFDEGKITAGIERYRSDGRALTAYLTGLVKRFNTQTEISVLKKKMEYYNVGREYLEAAYQARVAKHQLKRVDEAQAIEDKKLLIEGKRLQKELDMVDLEAQVRERTLRYKLSQIDAEEARLKDESKGKDLKESIGKIKDKVEIIEEFKQQMREKYPEDEAEEMIDEFIRMLIERQLTVIELSRFVDPESSFVRQLVLRETKNYEVLEEWERFEQAPRRDRESYVEAVFNRANKFAAGDITRRMFGQAKSTINFREAMDQGKIILCNLACNKLSEEEQRMLGVVITDKIIQAGKSRVDTPESRRRPFYFYLDEFGQFVSEDISKALQELRKFKVFLILAHQELEQLREENRKVYSAVMSEPQVRASFRISREDAEIMAKEMFTGKIRGDMEKRRIEQTKFRPVETERTIETESES